MTGPQSFVLKGDADSGQTCAQIWYTLTLQLVDKLPEGSELPFRQRHGRNERVGVLCIQGKAIGLAPKDGVDHGPNGLITCPVIKNVIKKMISTGVPRSADGRASDDSSTTIKASSVVCQFCPDAASRGYRASYLSSSLASAGTPTTMTSSVFL